MQKLTAEQQAGFKALRAPFPPNQISKLPKESKQQADARKADPKLGINCPICKGWHHRSAVHLDYVGHAALTDRLLEVDPFWNWEPSARDANGLPMIDPKDGLLWIKLTVCDKTVEGVGDAAGKTGGDAMKERIGDALRNAAMRFGCALDLWHKGDLHVDEEPVAEQQRKEPKLPPANKPAPAKPAAAPAKKEEPAPAPAATAPAEEEPPFIMPPPMFQDLSEARTIDDFRGIVESFVKYRTDAKLSKPHQIQGWTAIKQVAAKFHLRWDATLSKPDWVDERPAPAPAEEDVI
jgi:hypothetical protein